ncbi:U-box domain-containing protein 3 [Cornus florida]|uniref:U-box domain-containing protein 3 n=1 Tax=Cornus florida TaxID=4283 RepID=UPI00289DEDA3|nr:U-box domain-containing protein 3 [Cornus florida]
MEEVVEALFFGEREAQVAAARALNNLTSKQRQKFAERGVIAPLVSMLHTQDYEAIEAALFALLSLAFGSDRNKMSIVKSGAIPALLKLLQHQNEAFMDTAIAALLVLSSCTANKLSIAASGAIQVLVEFLNRSYIDEDNNISMQAKLDIIATLHHLSTCRQIIPSIVLSRAVFSLLPLIYGFEKSSELVEKAMGLLENIVSSSEIALRETASTSGAIQASVEAVEEGSPLCKEYAVGILLLICQSSKDRYRGLILSEGAIPGLLQLSMDGTRRAKEMARALLQLLRDCPSRNSRSRQKKNVLMEQAMEQIDAEERGGTVFTLEEMISKFTMQVPV